MVFFFFLDPGYSDGLLLFPKLAQSEAVTSLPSMKDKKVRTGATGLEKTPSGADHSVCIYLPSISCVRGVMPARL